MFGCLGNRALEPLALLAGRVLLASIFVHEGIGKIGNYSAAAAYVRVFGLPDVLLPAAIAIELVCGLSIALGLFTRVSAILLAGFCIVTAGVFHTKFSEINQLLHFEKNLAIAGGLLVLTISGPGRWAFGRRSTGNRE
jgi:putative oxidoreductase